MTTWILLRGLTREQGHWGHFPDQWLEVFPQDRVLTMELPGNGALHGQRSPASVAALAAHCHREAARLGLAPPFHLLAMSLGAMVATRWAVHHPADVAACVLINTSFGAFSPLHQRLRPRAWPTLLRLGIPSKPEEREHRIFRLTSSLPEPPAHLIEAWAALRRARPVRFGNAVRQLLAAARFHPPLRAPVPTLVLTSAGDRLVDPRCSRAIARRWGCALAVHPSAGHDLPLDDGPWVAQAVRRWLAGGDPAPTP
jgi:pimeloyl-ACP methyl ester carboxylesterase